MTQQRGANVSILIGFETAFAVAATAGFKMPINSINLRPSQTINTAATLQGNRNPVQPFRGNKDVNGTIVVPLDSRAMWYWFYAMFGAPTTSGSGPYEHVFKVPSFQPSLTIEEQFTDLDTDAYVRYRGCKIGSFSLDIGGDGELVATMNVVGADYDIATSPFDAAPTTVILDRVANFQAALTEGGLSFANATEFSVNLDMGLDTNQFVIGGGGVRGSIPEGIVGISGQLTSMFEDVSLINKAVNGAESELTLTITDNASSIVELEIQELEYAVNAPEVPGPQGLVQALDFQGFYADGSEASAIVARLTNVDEHA